MKVLVTGGAGFIGSNLCKALAEERHQIVVVDNLVSGREENLSFSSDLILIKGDIRDPEVVGRAIHGCDTIFHLAASVGNRRSIDNPLDDAGINVLGTIQVLEAARAAGVRKIVVSSSAGIFGELKSLPITEDHPTNPDSPYGVSKLSAEKVSLAYSKLYGIEVVCLRYFNVFGINQRFDAYGNVVPIFVFKILRGEPITVFGDGEQTRDFVNVRDVVKANLKASTAKGVTGTFNIGSGNATTINELVDALRRIFPEPFAVDHGSHRPGDVQHSRADISAAARAFGFAPSADFMTGLREYVGWARTVVAERQ